MKRIYTILLCGILTIPSVAGHFRVNNQLTTNPAAKIYTTLQAAHDAAVNNDTIMVEGSPVTYGDNFTCTKKLYIKGPGYFLDENPGISANKLPAGLFGMYKFNGGSSGSVLMGIDHTYMIEISAGNITIRRCNLKYLAIVDGLQNIYISVGQP